MPNPSASAGRSGERDRPSMRSYPLYHERTKSMADECTKKYYWLKLKRDFFKRHDIRVVEEMPNGKDYVLFYLKMLVESIDHDGELRFNESIPYNEQMLSVITNTNIDIVRSAMKLFIELNMIELFDDETIFMSEVQKLIGKEGESAERVRKHRARIEETRHLLQCNTDETKCNIEIELHKELNKKKDIKHRYGEYQNVLLSDPDLVKLKAEFPDWEERIEKLSVGIASKGYVYKNHLATIRNWARKDIEDGRTNNGRTGSSNRKSQFADLSNII
jgi:predicted phage replisome organizer